MDPISKHREELRGENVTDEQAARQYELESALDKLIRAWLEGPWSHEVKTIHYNLDVEWQRARMRDT